MTEQIILNSRNIQSELQKHYRFLHKNGEVGFDLRKTVDYVKSQLRVIGVEPADCGKCGVTAIIGKNTGRCILLRADMDALPLQEQTGLDFACTDGNMHACGHDMHTAMLLGAAKILKNNESLLNGTVKLMFQPAEEILAGANNMIENGVLKDPDVNAAIMLHSLAAFPVTSGTFIVPDGGVSAPAADFFTINVHGKGCHGSTPHLGVDSISVGAHILLALQELSAREMSISDEAVLTVGAFNGGASANIVADSTVLKGTMRSFDDELRHTLKKRLEEIAINIGKSFRAGVTVSFDSGCPTLTNDHELSAFAFKALEKLFGTEYVMKSTDIPGGFRGGSEDFSYISHSVPAIMLGFGAGEPKKGYTHPQHHPKVTFDDSVLWRGSGALSYLAKKYLDSNIEN